MELEVSTPNSVANIFHWKTRCLRLLPPPTALTPMATTRSVDAFGYHPPLRSAPYHHLLTTTPPHHPPGSTIGGGWEGREIGGGEEVAVTHLSDAPLLARHRTPSSVATHRLSPRRHACFARERWGGEGKRKYDRWVPPFF